MCPRSTLRVTAHAKERDEPARERVTELHMSCSTMRIVLLMLLTIAAYPAGAQEEGDDDPRGNVNLGLNIAAPLNPVARFVNIGWGMTTGAGYNFNRRNGIVNEFMWQHLFPTNDALTPIRIALQNPNLNASGDVIAFTSNYRFELRGKAVGTYFIGGGGLYYRTTSLSQRVTTGSNITCNPTWFWWGFSCSSGSVTANQTLASSSSYAMGGNVGIGFTARVGDAPYRVYVESRYHYAPSKNVNTQLVVVSVGIRY